MRRRLLIPPVFHIGRGEDVRKATWLELFYDLVYVAAVIELGYRLSDNVTAEGVLTFMLLFIPIWWSWIGTTFYSNRFDSDDLIHRILVFIQIFAISSLAINVYDGLGDTFTGFAISYAVVRVLLVLMYVRADYFIRESRDLTRRYIAGFGTAAVLWLIAAFLPTPLRFVVAGVAIVLDFYTAIAPGALKIGGRLPPSPHHLPERFGLFTIIVLGELFLKVTRELAGTTSPLENWFAGGFLFVAAVGLWWLYFDDIPEGRLVWGRRNALVWLMAHLPLQIGLTAFGVGFSKVVLVEAGEHLHDEYRLLAFGAVALALAMIAVLARVVTHSRGHQSPIEFAAQLVGVAILAGLALFGTALDHVVLAGIAAAVFAVLIALNIIFGEDEAEEGQIGAKADHPFDAETAREQAASAAGD